MSDAMWGGRFDLPMDHLVQEFNATILIEKRVTPFSIAVRSRYDSSGFTSRPSRS